jgi:hypothetical protein
MSSQGAVAQPKMLGASTQISLPMLLRTWLPRLELPIAGDAQTFELFVEVKV